MYQRHQAIGTYCSVSHPWKIGDALRTHHQGAMFWLGFRHAHGFIRVRLHMTEVMTPGETRRQAQRDRWLDERRRAFVEAIGLLDLPVEARVEQGNVALRSLNPSVPFFCS
nr:hypothetical protein [Nitrospirota bacterium]